MEDFKNYYRISQYARKLNVSDECIRLWVKSKKVKSVVIGGTVFVVDEN